MLEPQDRRLLIDSLRPPPGYSLDHAIGTTFSLDLMTLLTVPLAFTLFDWQDESGRPTRDRLKLIEALRRNANRLTLFCQGGRISIPRSGQALFAHLEPSVVQVRSPVSSGVFHPKVWLIRFAAPNGAVQYRLLVASRNLTFDRSWDTLLRLDGELSNRKTGIVRNQPLAEFVSALPLLATMPADERTLTNVAKLAHEVQRVQFELPDGFDKLRSWPLGVGGSRQWPFVGGIDRILVISPFVRRDCLRRLTSQGTGHILISRIESMNELDPPALRPLAQTLVLRDEASVEVTDVADADAESDAVLPPPDEIPLAGLHAKGYIADDGDHSRLWTGSANATDAAFNGNVEFLVELRGPKSRFGIDAVLARPENGVSLIDLLADYEPSVDDTVRDAAQEELERRIEEARRELVDASLIANAAQEDATDRWRVQLCLDADGAIQMPAAIRAECWPVTLRESITATKIVPGMGQLLPGTLADLGPMSVASLTSFFAFRVHARQGDTTASARFVLNVPLRGAPDDRDQQLLRSLMSNREQVLRYLLLLLAEAGVEPNPGMFASGAAGGSDGDEPTSIAGIPVFESMVRALRRDPSAIDHIAHFVDDLRMGPDGNELLPEGFSTIWDPIWDARQELPK